MIDLTGLVLVAVLVVGVLVQNRRINRTRDRSRAHVQMRHQDRGDMQIRPGSHW